MAISTTCFQRFCHTAAVDGVDRVDMVDRVDRVVQAHSRPSPLAPNEL